MKSVFKDAWNKRFSRENPQNPFDEPLFMVENEENIMQNDNIRRNDDNQLDFSDEESEASTIHDPRCNRTPGQCIFFNCANNIRPPLPPRPTEYDPREPVDLRQNNDHFDYDFEDRDIDRALNDLQQNIEAAMHNQNEVNQPPENANINAQNGNNRQQENEVPIFATNCAQNKPKKVRFQRQNSQCSSTRNNADYDRNSHINRHYTVNVDDISGSNSNRNKPIHLNNMKNNGAGSSKDNYGLNNTSNNLGNNNVMAGYNRYIPKIKRDFDSFSPLCWLESLEASFLNYNITDEHVKYELALQNIKTHDLQKLQPYLADRTFTALANGVRAVFGRKTFSDRLNTVDNLTLTSTPRALMTDILSEMRLPIDGLTNEQNDFIKHVFAAKMPAKIQLHLQPLPSNTTLEEYCRFADRCFNVILAAKVSNKGLSQEIFEETTNNKKNQ